MKRKSKICKSLGILGVTLALVGCGGNTSIETVTKVEELSSETSLLDETVKQEAIKEKADSKDYKSTYKTIVELVKSYEDDGVINNHWEAIAKHFYEESQEDEYFFNGKHLEDNEDEIFYCDWATPLTYEECQNIEYESCGYVSEAYKYYVLPLFPYSSNKIGYPISIVIPKGYIKLEDLTLTKDSIYGPMSWKGQEFSFYMSEISEDKYYEIRDWYNYIYNLEVDEAVNIKHIADDSLVEGALTGIGIYDSYSGTKVTRNIIWADRTSAGPDNARYLYFNIGITADITEDLDNIISLDECMSLMQSIGNQNCDYYDIVRYWNYYDLDKIYQLEEIEEERPVEEADITD